MYAIFPSIYLYIYRGKPVGLLVFGLAERLTYSLYSSSIIATLRENRADLLLQKKILVVVFEKLFTPSIWLSSGDRSV